MARYSVNNYTVDTLLSSIKSGGIAIPEMQRPFVWDGTKVRDLIDSLYKGFPVGYIIVWQNPDVKLKDGTTSSGKRVLIDGQQRITAMALPQWLQPLLAKKCWMNTINGKELPLLLTLLKKDLKSLIMRFGTAVNGFQIFALFWNRLLIRSLL